jgi:hypothetical protein
MTLPALLGNSRALIGPVYWFGSRYSGMTPGWHVVGTPLNVPALAAGAGQAGFPAVSVTY